MALGKPTNQSSTSYNGVSSRAVDGDTNSKFFDGKSCTHTGGPGPQWWMVDLQITALITKVFDDYLNHSIERRNVECRNVFVFHIFLSYLIELSILVLEVFQFVNVFSYEY